MSASATFKDLFSVQAKDYARYRPTYPRELYDILVSLTPVTDLVWDVGTGNGQAATELAQRFKHVHATDPSAKQLAEAVLLPNIHYAQEAAEAPSLAPASANLITVAQAFHWFKHDQFARTCAHVSAPGAHLAVWCYALAHIPPELQASVDHLYNGLLGPYWEKERQLVEEGYASISMPFKEVRVPPINMQADWTLEQMLGYFKTWSALNTYLKSQDPAPVMKAFEAITKAWGSVESRRISWPLALRVWKISA